MSTLGPRTALKSRKLSGSLAYILAQTNVKQGTKAAPNDVAGCALEMGADGLWTGASVGTLTQVQADALVASGALAKVKVGTPATVNGRQVTWGGAGVGWVALRLNADIDFPLRRTSGNILTPAFLANSQVGKYDDGGVIKLGSGYNCTDFIPVVPGYYTYFVANVAEPPVIAGSFYNSSKEFLTGGGLFANGFGLVPSGAAFWRANYDSSTTPAAFVAPPVAGSSENLTNKIYFAGDSTTVGIGSTAGNSYPEVFSRKLDFPAVIVNGGVSDSTVTNLAGHNPFSVRILTGVVPVDAALLIIKYGINDYRYGVTLGAIGDSTDATFYGALKVVMEYMKVYRPATRTVFIKPLYTVDSITPNSPLSLFWKAIDDTAALYGVTVIDDNDAGVPTIGAQTYLYGGNGTTILHPNNDGYRILGEYAAMALSRR